MVELTPKEKEEIIRRRRCISDGDKKKHPINSLEIHHKDRNRNNNKPQNLRVLTKKQHKKLHERFGR